LATRFSNSLFYRVEEEEALFPYQSTLAGWKPTPTLAGPETVGPTASCHIPCLAQSWTLGFLFKIREEICTSGRCFGVWAESRKYPYITYMDS